jgi:hypothetical protein
MRATSNVLVTSAAAGDQARLGGGPAHIEAQEAILAEAPGEPAASQGTRRRTTRPDGSARGGIVGGRPRRVRRIISTAAEALAEPLLQLVEVPAR